MKTTTYYILVALAVLLLSIKPADACSLNPTAVITTEPDARVLYNGEPVLLSGENSVANCGFIDQYRWRARPVGGTYITLYQGSSPTYNLTVPLLNDGETERLYEVELRVRNSSNLYHTRTIQVTVTRNNKSFYYLTDHLGSVRVTVDERGDPVGWDDYYPFGLQMPDRSQQQYGSPLTDAKFTGHELNQEGGLGLYHAGARLYDPEIGRFMQQDPLTGMYPGWSPYNYVLGNPVNYLDPDGRFVVRGGGRYLTRVTHTEYYLLRGISMSGPVGGATTMASKMIIRDPSIPVDVSDHISVWVGGGLKLGGNLGTSAIEKSGAILESSILRFHTEKIGYILNTFSGLESDKQALTEISLDMAMYFVAEQLDWGATSGYNDRRFDVSEGIFRSAGYGRQPYTRANIQAKFDNLREEIRSLADTQGYQLDNRSGWGAFMNYLEENWDILHDKVTIIR
jgi:RHS repeat-associated protein